MGAWAGLSVHEVAQVVAAASPAGAAAVAVAVVVKLTRVCCWPRWWPASAWSSEASRDAHGRRPPIVPLFVVGFLGMMRLRSAGVVPAGDVGRTQMLTTLLFAAALFGLGSAVRFGDLLRNGRRGIALGALSTALVGLLGLGTLFIAGTL